MMQYGFGQGGFGQMMYGGGFGFLAMQVAMIVWLVVGVLLAIYLWQRISKK